VASVTSHDHHVACCSRVRPLGWAHFTLARRVLAPQLYIDLFQPECHAHLAVHRGGGGEVLLRFGTVAGASVELAGVYTRASPTARPRFHHLPPPTDADIAALLTGVHRRVQRLLIRRGRWPADNAGSDPFAAQEPLFAGVVAASLQGRMALGPRAGQPVRRLRSAADAIATGRRSARLEGFSLHADVAVPARRWDQLERVCRYILRPLSRSRSPSACPA
jgi:hypothetical protein